MAASEQHEADNQSLATLSFLDLFFSHSDASISRKFRLVTIRQLSISMGMLERVLGGGMPFLTLTSSN